MHIESVVDDIRGLPASAERDAFLAFLRETGAAALWRDDGGQHLTGSCFVFSPDLARVLLCFHRKGRFWVQFGGHLEPRDATIADTALREAREESGIEDLQLWSTEIVDLDRHELHGGFRCSAHWDIAFAAIADPDAALVVSDESEDLAWFAVGSLPRDTPEGLATRLRTAARAIARRRS